MTVFALKTYQTDTLRALGTYLAAARVTGAKPAFDGMEKHGVRTPRAYRPLPYLPTVPYICLRLPTGGGKTLLSAHTVKLAADAYLEREFPLVLWLVPTNTIRTQTLDTLKQPGNPNHETLRTAFDGRFRVFDIADFANITPADLQTHACIIVGTMQTLRVSNTDGRRVYAHNENLEPHFSTVPHSAPGMDRIDADNPASPIKFSFRNLLARNRPLVIVDEAHNNTSSLSYEVLQRINAACVIEFTATPATDSNVLHNVSATELKAEDMIKLPIRLTPHDNWESAVRDSLRTRQHLLDVAAADPDYIRPIILFQAEEKGRDVTKEVLRQHLLDAHAIPPHKIAVVTGDQKDLAGVNLFAPDCPIDYVITVEALKEGWDCSFAYVFCSVATVNSTTAVEQILGRVLRMPYAKRRTQVDLNRAYAHVSRASWPNAVKLLHDRLVDMGFEDNEADAYIEPTLEDHGLTGGATLFTPTPPPTIIDLSEDLSAFAFTAEESATVTIEKTETGSRLILTGPLPDATFTRLAAATRSADARTTLQADAKRHHAVWQQYIAPAQRGVPFRVPQLCFTFDDTLEPIDRDALLDAAAWSPLDYSTEITEADFRITETGIQWEIDLSAAGKITERAIGTAEQIDLDLVDTGWTQAELNRWLERKVRTSEFAQAVWLEFTRRAIAYLIDQRHLPLTALVRWKFVLAKVLTQKISLHRDQASLACYQKNLFGPQAAVETSFAHTFDFTPNTYPSRWAYPGNPHIFARHYYPIVGELENQGEEYECARALDMSPGVKHWVRNLERRGFSLPLAKSKFYPDFVAELTDGRLLVVEHKGKVYATNDDSKEKANIGALWEQQSAGKALFLMTVVQKGSPTLSNQIAAKIG